MVYLRKLMSNVFFLKYFVINYVLNFMYIYNAPWKISKWKYYDFGHAVNCIRKLGCVPAHACAIVCASWNSLWIFGKWFTKMLKKKKHFIKNICILYGSQTYWSFMKFYFVHILKFFFVFKKQSLCLYSSVYV